MIDTATLLLPMISTLGQIISGKFDYFLNDDHKVKPSKIRRTSFKGNFFVFPVSPGEHILVELS